VPYLKQVLAQEEHAKAILAWAIRGTRDWYAELVWNTYDATNVSASCAPVRVRAPCVQVKKILGTGECGTAVKKILGTGECGTAVFEVEWDDADVLSYGDGLRHIEPGAVHRPEQRAACVALSEP
jgi:hypothetical protein